MLFFLNQITWRYYIKNGYYIKMALLYSKMILNYLCVKFGFGWRSQENETLFVGAEDRGSLWRLPRKQAIPACSGLRLESVLLIDSPADDRPLSPFWEEDEQGKSRSTPEELFYVVFVSWDESVARFIFSLSDNIYYILKWLTTITTTTTRAILDN